MAARDLSIDQTHDGVKRKLTDQESQRLYPLIIGLSLSDRGCLSGIGSFEPLLLNAQAQIANLKKVGSTTDGGGALHMLT